MAEPKTEQEPSIEEILESIRQIISDDGEPAANANSNSDLTLKGDVSVPPAPSNLTLKGEPEQPVQASNLTLKGQSEQSVPPSDLTLTGEDQQEDLSNILDLVDVVQPEPAKSDLDLSAAPEQPAGESVMTDPVATDDDQAILSNVAADAATAAMAKLLASNVAVERAEPGRVGAVTLEDLTKEMLRPLVKNWLDKNLPKLIEKMVAKEIEKLSRRALDE